MLHPVRLVVAALAAGLLLAGASALQAQDTPQTLVIGGTRALTIRTGDTLNGREMSIQARIDHVQDVYAKYLGGAYAKFTWKKWRDRVHIYLNNQFVLAVTPADAQATGYKTAAELAPVWLQGLQKAFNTTHVHVSGKK